MNKRTLEKLEREKLKQLLDDNPKLKEVIDNLIENKNPEVVDVVKPAVEQALRKELITGVKIGWQSAFIQAYEKIKNMQSVNEIKTCLRSEADAVRKYMGLKSAFDDDGNLIIENGDVDEV